MWVSISVLINFFSHLGLQEPGSPHDRKILTFHTIKVARLSETRKKGGSFSSSLNLVMSTASSSFWCVIFRRRQTTPIYEALNRLTKPIDHKKTYETI